MLAANKVLVKESLWSLLIRSKQMCLQWTTFEFHTFFWRIWQNAGLVSTFNKYLQTYVHCCRHPRLLRPRAPATSRHHPPQIVWPPAGEQGHVPRDRSPRYYHLLTLLKKSKRIMIRNLISWTQRAKKFVFIWTDEHWLHSFCNPYLFSSDYTTVN